jgi:PAS domain S-box-containing protein
VCYVRSGVAERYPLDEGLRSMGAESYVGTALRGSAGEPLGLVNAIHDRPLDDVVRPEAVLQVFAARAAAEIQRLRAERELERQRVFADSLLDMVASLVMVVDSRGRVVRFNRSCEQTSGWSEDELRGRPFWELLRPEATRAEAAARFQGGVASAHGYESEWQTRSGERRLISWIIRPLQGSSGETAYVLGTGTDITERRRLEADLRRAALEWREAFDGLPLGVLVVDAHGRVVRANRTAVEQSGRGSWGELIDSELARLGPGEPWGALGELAAALRDGGEIHAREMLDAHSGRTWVVSGRSLTPEAEGGAGRAVLNFQDVTETVQLKEQLRQSETMAEIGSIVAGVAHEVRNPLFSISATLDALESRFRATEGYERYFGVLRGEITRLTALMKDLLDFGRPSRPDLVECRMEEVVEAAVSACAPLARRKAIEVSWPRAAAVPRVLADRARITQVLQNLIENALHFSPAGGRVDVSLSGEPGSAEPVVVCSVKDSGPGFDPNDLSRLFEPFFTRRRGGIGLGLSIVKRIVYDHGGEVSAENHADGGAVVRVRLRGIRA